MPGLEPGMEMRSTKLAKGIVRLSEFHGVGTPPRLSPRVSQKPTFGLRYGSMSEMVSDHGMSVISGILMDADLWMLRPGQRDALIAEIKPNVHEEIWPMIAERLRPPLEEEGEEDLGPVSCRTLARNICQAPPATYGWRLWRNMPLSGGKE